MKKCAKVICVWFGDKRPGNSNVNTTEIIEDMIDNEMTIDTGYPTDTIWVINKCGNELWDNYLDRYILLDFVFCILLKSLWIFF